jgi:hypothetical protein
MSLSNALRPGTTPVSKFCHFLVSTPYTKQKTFITMSWQAYVDNNLVGTGTVTKGALFGHNGGKWAASAGFNVIFTLRNKLLILN